MIRHPRSWLVTAVLAAAVMWRLLEASRLEESLPPGPIALTGMVQEAPVRRPGRLEVVLGRLREAKGQRQIGSAALVWLPPYRDVAYGDELAVTGVWTPAWEVTPPGYARYLHARGLAGLMRRPEMRVLTTGRGPPWLLALHRLRSRAEQVAARIYPEPEASLLTGVVLGSRGRMPSEAAERFRRSGTSHVLVVSGFNVTLLAALALALARPLGARPARASAAALVTGYCLLVGLEPPVVRAGLMAGLYLLARELGRPADVLRVLLITGLVMLLWRPASLWEVSFQLSFAATLGLILAARPLQERLGRPGRGVLGETLAVTTAAQLFTAPVQLAQFHTFSLLSLPANLLIVPLQPLILVGGVCVLGLGLLHLPAAQLVGWLLWPALHGTIEVVEALGGLPWAMVELSPASAQGTAVAAAAVLAAVAARRRLRSWLTSAVPAMAGAGLLLAVSIGLPELGKRPDGRLHVWFLDVGQGDGILLRLPEGQFLLLDGGPEEGLAVREVARRLPVWRRRLDGVLISHTDQDHLMGSLGVLRSLPVSLALAPAGALGHPAGASWAEAAGQAGARVQEVTAPVVLSGGSLRLRVLHPPAAAPGNRGSMVLLVEMGQVRFLLPGDLEAEDAGPLLSGGAVPPVTVLQLPHHGSRDGRVEELLDAARPAVAVISVGKDNRYGHPHPDTLAALERRGIPVFRTDLRGTLEWITDGRSLWLRAGRAAGG